uniref:Uncharacterized protein n=1 Tax=Salvator merianae TaxID=96440 RepID=A0A8D0DWZ7_SALMN
SIQQDTWLQNQPIVSLWLALKLGESVSNSWTEAHGLMTLEWVEGCCCWVPLSCSQLLLDCMGTSMGTSMRFSWQGYRSGFAMTYSGIEPTAFSSVRPFLWLNE